MPKFRSETTPEAYVFAVGGILCAATVWLFHYILPKKVFCGDIVNNSDVRFIKNSQGYLEDFNIQVNDAEFADKKCGIAAVELIN